MSNINPPPEFSLWNIKIWSFYFLQYHGRIRKADYQKADFWLWVMMLWILPSVGGLLFNPSRSNPFIEPLALFAMAFVAFASAMLSIKRAHDLGESGTFLFKIFIPVYGMLLLSQLFFKEGERGDNQYGLGKGTGEIEP